ncbi:hypothetical protein [Streptomyces lancefieldiae]|uniref:Integral membrane protein n=1 Tax=Streptomyces lancefieldiae TaxID=3075520 RepID=A0ABU3AGG8_9ACTN|nr:hypothetical protein [Streptomyces sp. DSM 40712]MDT0609059.1 hypothetical protein [Streptomyces sp. DSM 40712]
MLEDIAQPRDEASTESRPMGILVAALFLPAALATWIVVWIVGNAQKLMAGESATMRSVTRCVEGGGPALPPSSCSGSWAFTDGRTGVGDITTGKNGVSVGDTVFAGDTWAYASPAPLHRLVFIPIGAVCAGVLIAMVIWVSHRRRTRSLAGVS